jgi:signal transduction histidine kinase
VVSTRARILLFSIVIMAVVSISTAAIAIYVLYEAGFRVHRARLREVVESRARIIEAVARFDSRFSQEDFPGGAAAATLSQVIEAHEHFEGFGETGEFTLARREGDEIVWLLGHRHPHLEEPRPGWHGDVDLPPPIPLSSGLAEPMCLALSGESGTIVGLDYRGVEVLAAYEWIPELGWGVVAKIDIAEVRRPLVRAGVMASAIALLVVAIGVGFIFRLTFPLIRSIEARTREVENAHERLRDHSSQVSLEVERARRELAIDLHDGIGQLLALVNIKLGLLRGNPGVDTLDSRLQEIEGLTAEARERSREMTWRLSPPVLYEVGLTAALRWLAKDMEQRYGLRVTVEEEGESGPLDETTRISLFRSVNELLTNVAKHAKVDQAAVRVSSWVRDIMIVVEDRGVGFDPSSQRSEYGLFSVRERMHHLDGILRIASKPGEGTRIILVAPVETADSETNAESP